MIESRDLNELLPIVKAHAIMAIAAAEMRTGLKLIVTCTYRDDERQRVYYEQGRTLPGKIVTNEPGPGGAHALRVALDIAPAIKDNHGIHLFYETSKWEQIAECFKQEGFQWGGDWLHIKDKPHFQYTQVLTLAMIRTGSRPS